MWNIKELFTHQRTPENTMYCFYGETTQKPNAFRELEPVNHSSTHKNEVRKLTRANLKYTDLWLTSSFPSRWREGEGNNNKITPSSQVWTERNNQLELSFDYLSFLASLCLQIFTFIQLLLPLNISVYKNKYIYFYFSPYYRTIRLTHYFRLQRVSTIYIVRDHWVSSSKLELCVFHP